MKYTEILKFDVEIMSDLKRHPNNELDEAIVGKAKVKVILLFILSTIN